MECPHCNYRKGYYWDEDDNYVEAINEGRDKGDFWSLPVKLERNENSYSFQNAQASLYACPKCTKTFIED